MKKLSGPKLLRMALNNQHISYCNHLNSNFPVGECKCWLYEVSQWSERIKLVSKKRKPKLGRVHYQFASHCPAKGNKTTTLNMSEVTCRHCAKLIATNKHDIRPAITYQN